MHTLLLIYKYSSSEYMLDFSTSIVANSCSISARRCQHSSSSLMDNTHPYYPAVDLESEAEACDTSSVNRGDWITHENGEQDSDTLAVTEEGGQAHNPEHSSTAELAATQHDGTQFEKKTCTSRSLTSGSTAVRMSATLPPVPEFPKASTISKSGRKTRPDGLLPDIPGCGCIDFSRPQYSSLTKSPVGSLNGDDLFKRSGKWLQRRSNINHHPTTAPSSPFSIGKRRWGYYLYDSEAYNRGPTSHPAECSVDPSARAATPYSHQTFPFAQATTFTSPPWVDVGDLSNTRLNMMPPYSPSLPALADESMNATSSAAVHPSMLSRKEINELLMSLSESSELSATQNELRHNDWRRYNERTLAEAQTGIARAVKDLSG